jgi:hypothetical protein
MAVDKDIIVAMVVYDVKEMIVVVTVIDTKVKMGRCLGGKPFIMAHIVGVRDFTLIENLYVGLVGTYHYFFRMVIPKVILKKAFALVGAVMVAHCQNVETFVLVKNLGNYFMVDQIPTVNHQSYLIAVAEPD